MSQENVGIVVGQFEGTNAREFAAVRDTWSEDVTLVVHSDLGVVPHRPVAGKEAVGEWFGDWFRQFSRDYSFEVEESRDLGERIFMVATHHGRGRVSEVPVTLRTAYLYTLRAGKISRIEVWAERAAALEAAGLSE